MNQNQMNVDSNDNEERTMDFQKNYLLVKILYKLLIQKYKIIYSQSYQKKYKDDIRLKINKAFEYERFLGFYKSRRSSLEYDSSFKKNSSDNSSNSGHSQPSSSSSSSSLKNIKNLPSIKKEEFENFINEIINITNNDEPNDSVEKNNIINFLKSIKENNEENESNDIYANYFNVVNNNVDDYEIHEKDVKFLGNKFKELFVNDKYNTTSLYDICEKNKSNDLPSIKEEEFKNFINKIINIIKNDELNDSVKKNNKINFLKSIKENNEEIESNDINTNIFNVVNNNVDDDEIHEKDVNILGNKFKELFVNDKYNTSPLYDICEKNKSNDLNNLLKKPLEEKVRNISRVNRKDKLKPRRNLNTEFYPLNKNYQKRKYQNILYQNRIKMNRLKSSKSIKNFEKPKFEVNDNFTKNLTDYNNLNFNNKKL